MILGVDDLVAIRLAAGRLIAGGPDLAGASVPQEHVAPPVVACHVLPPAGDGDVAPAAVPGAGGRRHYRVATVRQQVGPRDRVVRRGESAEDGGDEVADVRGAL